VTERALFEDWFGTPHGQKAEERFARKANGQYTDLAIQLCWEGWAGKAGVPPNE
jgi:hypothetical protein